MERRVYTRRGTLAAVLPAACLLACRPSSGRVRLADSRRAMGVPWTITLFAPTDPAGREALAAAFAEVARLDAILSDYDPASELSRLSAAAPTSVPIPVGPDLWNVLHAAVVFRDASAGAFDPTVGPLTTLWRQARRTRRMPAAEKLAQALAAVGPDALVLDGDRRAVHLPRAGARLDLGGIAMGYTADRVLRLLRDRGIEAALVDASGDVAAAGRPPGTGGWRVAVAGLAGAGEPTSMIELVDAAVTTSGDAFQAVEIDGVRYSHIVDPRTGLGIVGPAAVTVIAGDCTTADALATATSVLGARAGSALIDTFPGAAGRFLWTADGRLHESTTFAWPSQPAQGRGLRPRL
jgi:thiamine biosynthesis lipoprotein